MSVFRTPGRRCRWRVERYSRIVTRKRYAKGVPVISRMIKLYEYPVVDSKGGLKGQIEMLRAVARDPRAPIVVYPEGTRSHDGELLPFRRGAVDTLLRHRRWKVYLLTADGTLPCGRLKDMLNGVKFFTTLFAYHFEPIYFFWFNTLQHNHLME